MKTMKTLEDEAPPREGPVAKAIEAQTSKLPSDVFLWAGLGVFAAAFALQLNHKKSTALFLEPLAPMMLLFGIYNKIVKLEGHDRYSRPSRK